MNPAQSPVPAGNAQPHILIAEDEPVFRRVIIFTLQRQGFKVTATVNGAEAWKQLQSHSYDALVTDHQMPGGNGIELLENLRTTELHGRLPTILCTAKGFELDASYLIDRFRLITILHKPFSPQRLAGLLRDHCLQSNPAHPAIPNLGSPTVESNPGVIA
ncbi:response regulator [Planctomycetaceae bacterium SH139]